MSSSGPYASTDSPIDAAIRALRDKATPPYLDDLLDEMAVRDVVAEVDPREPYVRVGGFELIESIGIGGYGRVIAGRDPELGRPVALKMCATTKPNAEELLMAEARILAQLSHPNIITIHETGRYGPNGEGLFLVMEYASGGSMAERRGRPWRELVPLFADIARGLAAAHAHGVIHGDVKPSNFLLHGDGRPRVADFGLSRIIGAAPLLPRAVGTLPYAAPEVLRGGELGPLSDQWSFFVALWECLDRRLPFMTNVELKRRFLTLTEAEMVEVIEQWPGVDALESEVPGALREILRVGLALDPRKRFADMEAVADALDRVVELADGAPPRRGRGKPGLLALVLVAGAGLLGQGYVMGQRASDLEQVPQAKPVEPSKASSEASDTGEAQLRAALETAKRLSPDAKQGDIYDIFERWSAGWTSLHASQPRLAASLTLEIADAIDANFPGDGLPARLADRAAQEFEMLEAWNDAADAQARAVELYKRATALDHADLADQCLERLRAERPCDRGR